MTYRKRVSYRGWLLVGFLMFSGLSDLLVQAQQQPPVEQPRKPLYFRRVYVPAGDLDDLIKGTMPLKRESFLSMVEAINRNTRDVLTSSEVRVVSAQYSARLLGDDLVDGSALLEIEKPPGNPALLPFSPSGLAWGRPQWEAETVLPAVAGVDGTGRWFVLVEKSGRLRIPWSLKGRVVSGKRKQFDFWVPPSSTNRLEVQLPEQTILSSSNGFASPRSKALGTKPAAAVKEGDLSGQAESSSDSATASWIVELGGHQRTLLSVAPRERFQERDALVIFRQADHYTLSRTGLDLEVGLQVDIHHQPIRQLRLRLDRGLQLLTAQLGKERLRWTAQETPEGQQVILHFLEPLSGTGRDILFKATAPLVPGKTWQLPAIRLLDGVWREEQANITLKGDLTLVKLEATGCHETAMAPGVSASQGESRLFQFYQPEGSMKVLLERRDAGIHLDVGTRIDLASERMSGLVVADVTADYGQQFFLEGKLPPSWIVDTVETEPSELLDDYEVVRGTGATKTKGVGRQRHLVVRLNRAIQKGQDVRIIVRGHARVTQGRIDGSLLRMVDFQATESKRAVIAVGLETGFQLRTTGDLQLERLQGDEVQSAFSEMLDLDSTALLFLDNPAYENFRLQSYQEQTRYSSEIHVHAVFGPERLEEQYRITCTPENAPVRRLLVHFYRSRQLPMQWTVPGAPTTKLVARRLDEEEQELRGLSDGETWEVSLEQSRLEPFQLLGVRNVPVQQSAQICLAAMPEAVSQFGSLSVRVPDANELGIDHGSLKRIPAPFQASGRTVQVRGVYHYDPSQDSPVRVTREATTSSQDSLWVWDCQLQSRFTTSGYATHRAVYHLENKGALHLNLRLPAGAELQELMVDREVIGLVGAQRDERQLEVPLPLQSQFPVVKVRYAIKTSALRTFAGLKAPLPLVQCAVLHTQWQVLLPPGYALFSRETVGSTEGEPLSIGRRLFGPLYRDPDTGPFRLLATSDWQRIIGRSSIGMDVRQRADECVRQLGRSFHLVKLQTAPQQSFTWQDVLENYLRIQNRLTGAEFDDFWVDPEALSHVQADAGRGPAGSQADPWELGQELLRTAHLCLLVSEKSVVLTTRSRASENVAGHNMDRQLVVQVVDTDRLASQIRRASASQENPWVDLRRWLGDITDSSSPWVTLPQSPYTQISDSRWTRHSFALKPGDVSRIVVCRPLVLHSFAWSGLLIWAGLFAWLFASRPQMLLQVMVLSGLVALLAPSNVYPAPTCLFLGSLLAGLLLVTWRHARAGDAVRLVPTDFSFDLQPVPRTLISVLLFLGFTTLTIWSLADEPEDGPAKTVQRGAPQLEKVYRLLIPVDENNKAVGQYDYLPEAFFDALHRRAEKTTQRKSGWLATEAEYRAECDWVAVRNGLENPVFVVTVKLEALNPQQIVKIQVPRETVELTAAELNGEEIAINWSAEGDALLVAIEEPGPYTLVYHLRPIIRRINGKRAIQFKIPSIPSTRLRFPDSVEMPDISVLKSWGTVRRQLPTRDLVAELGGCGELGFTWTWQQPVQEVAAQTSVEQLAWMNVRPHSVVMDTKFRFSVLRGKVDQVQFRVDPRLRMLPLSDGQPVRGAPRVREGDINTIHLDLAEPMEEDFTVEMRFYMDKTSGVGQLQLPTLEAIADRVLVRQLGISVSDKLQWEASPVTEAQQLMPMQFAQRWGTADRPDLALRLPTTDASWQLNTRRRIAESAVKQQLDVVVGSQRLAVECEMEINTTGSLVFQHRFQLPTGFRVKEVHLSKNAQPVLIRTAFSTDEELSVFVPEGVMGQQKLTLKGELPHNGKTVAVPEMLFETGETLSRRARIYRKPEVLVQVSLKNPANRLANHETGRFYAGFGRIVADWTESFSDAKAERRQQTLKILPNQRRLRCNSVTRVFRKEVAWWTAIDCHVTVLSGVCDEIQIDIPESWTGNFQLTPAMPFEIKRLPGVPQPRLIIRPATALSGDFRVHIESPLVFPGGGIRVPEIVPLGMQRTVRYVVMPNRLDQQKLAWETSGLQRIARLPETLAGGVVTTDSTIARVVSAHFRARIKEVQQIKTDPFIHLVDVRLGWTVDGECSGVTTFDLEPAGRTECVLRVPSEYQVIAVRVAGLPGVLKEINPGRFSLQLGPSQLAQRIEVVFRGQIEIQTSVVKRVKTVTPMIEDFPVQRTLWTVRAPNSIGNGRPRVQEGTTTAESHVRQRLETIATLVETATENRSELTGQRLKDWFLPWERRFASIEAEWNRFQGGKTRMEGKDEMLAISDRYQTLKRRLGVEEFSHRGDLEMLGISGAEEVWETVVVGTDVLSDFEGQQIELDLVYPGMRRSSDFGLRLLVSLGFLFVAGIGWKLKQLGSLGEWWARWPYVTGVGLGLCWWLWLWPSLLGLVIIMISALAAIVPSWAPLSLSEASSDSKTITDYPHLPLK